MYVCQFIDLEKENVNDEQLKFLYQPEFNLKTEGCVFRKFS